MTPAETINFETINCFLDVVPKIIENIEDIWEIDKPRARSFIRRVVSFEDGSVEAVGEMTSEDKQRDQEFATRRVALISERTALVSSLPNPGNIIEVFSKYKLDAIGLYEVHDLLSREKLPNQLPERDEIRIDWSVELPNLNIKWQSVSIGLRVLKDHLNSSPAIPNPSERQSLNRHELGIRIKDVLDKERGKEWTASDLKVEIELNKLVKTSESNIKKTPIFKDHIKKTGRSRHRMPKTHHLQRPIESKGLSPSDEAMNNEELARLVNEQTSDSNKDRGKRP